MFSDEKSVSRFGTSGRQFYFKRPENKTPREHHKKGTKRGGGGKMCLWGCLTDEAPGDLCRLSGYMDAETYVDVVKSYVIKTWEYHGLERENLIFQQDNASAHTANRVKEYMAKQKITVLEWPPNSPDLNIIENVWAYLNQELDRYDMAPEDMDDLWERVQVVWENIHSPAVQLLTTQDRTTVYEAWRQYGLLNSKDKARIKQAMSCVVISKN